MLKKGNKIVVAMLCLSLLVLLAACGGEQGGADEPVTIVYQSWNPVNVQMEPVLADWAERFPDITLEYVMVPFTDHMQNLMISLAAGEGPDVIALQTGAPLREFSDFTVELTQRAIDTWGENWEDIFIPFAIELLREPDGSFYAMPLGMGFAGTIWADLYFFNKYDLEVPSNLDELIEVAGILRGHGEMFPLAIGAGDDWINLDMWMNIMNDINSSKLYSAIEGDTPFTDPEVVRSFEIWQLLFTERVFQDGALGMNMYFDTTDLFERERIVPMITNGAWTINSYPHPDPDVFATFNDGLNPKTVFTMDWNNDGRPAPVQANVEIAMTLNTNSPNPDEAWQFISYMMFEGQDILVNEFLMYFPSRIDMEYTGELSEEGMRNLAILMDLGANHVGGYREMPYPELVRVIADTLQALALEDVTPQEAGERVEAVSRTIQR